jgi:hypothetical protein
MSLARMRYGEIENHSLFASLKEINEKQIELVNPYDHRKMLATTGVSVNFMAHELTRGINFQREL